MVVALGVLTSTGCSGDTPARHRAAAAPRSTTSAAEPSPAPATGTSDAAPTPGSMATPGTTAGRLTGKDFPTLRQLGAGWEHSVDAGDAEEGYSGNGTPVLERNATEVGQTAVPFGCERPTAMPAPRYALETDYSHRGSKVIAVRSQFADARAARAFYEGRAANLRACLGTSGSEAIGPLVARVSSPARDALASDRTPRSDPWRELSLLDGDTVVMVAAQGAGSLPDPLARTLVRLFRR